MENDLKLLQEGANKLGLMLDPIQIKQFKDFKDYTLDINKSMNLTAITDDNDFIIKHFLDSLTLTRVHKFDKGERVLDMGTGGGYPGIPLKILYPDTNFLLIDSLKKRIDFLNNLVERLNLQKINCIHSRAEELGQDKEYRESFDIVVSRAVANLSILSEYCVPFLKLGGFFFCLKGPRHREEIHDGRVAISKLGASLEEVIPVKLPFSDITRFILIIKKVRQTPTKYPRKPGQPTKNPLK